MITKDDIIVKMIGTKRGLLIDVGGGNGVLEDKLPSGIDYQNVDWSKYATVHADLNNGKVPILSNSADIVVCSETLEHLHHPRKIMKELNRIVKKEGIIIVTMPNEYNLYLRLRYLFGMQTLHNIPFQDNGEQHIHLPSIENIVDFVGSEIEVYDIQYLFISHKKYWFDPILNWMAQRYPSLFARNVIIKGVKSYEP